MSSVPLRIEDLDPAALEPGVYLPLRPAVLSLPGGETLHWQLPIIRGRRPGKTVFAFAGAHGDDFESSAALRGLIDRLIRRPLDEFAGTLVTLPQLHPAAFTAGTRGDPFSGTDAAAAFGAECGAGAGEQLAARLRESLLPRADLVVELYDEPAALEALPTAGYSSAADAASTAAADAAAALGLTAVWPSPPAAGRASTWCVQKKIPAVWVRLGGGGRCRPAAVARAVDGLENLLVYAGLLGGAVRTTQPEFRFDAKMVEERHRTPAGGVFEAVAAVGATVARGALLGRVVDPAGTVQFEALSRAEGVVTVLRTCPRTAPGDVLAAVVKAG
jgi:hypothetical protein